MVKFNLRKKKEEVAIELSDPVCVHYAEPKIMKSGMAMFPHWPQIFIDENFEYEEKDKKTLKAIACADGLSGWGLCMSGFKAPKPFGMAMVKIGNILGIAVTSDDLMEYSKNKRWEE